MIIYPWKGWRIQPKEIREALKWYDYAADLRPDIFVISEDVRYLVHDLVSYMRESLEYGGFKTNVADYI